MSASPLPRAVAADRTVLLFVLRRALPRTRCLVSEGAHGAVGPLALRVAAEESDAEVVRTALTSFPTAKLYATGAAPVPIDGGIANAFVAILDEEVDCDPAGWCPLADAVHRFETPALRQLGRSILERFVRRAPDEALRIS